MPNYVCDISKRNLMSYVIKGIELFKFSLINQDTVEILCECGHSFQAKINGKINLIRCEKCGCLWDIEEDADKISLVQPRTNFGLTFGKTKKFLDEVDIATIKADEERMKQLIDIDKHKEIDDVLSFVKRSGINQKELIKALRSNK